MQINNFIQGVFSTISDPFTLLVTFIGTVIGLVFGSLPGLTATMGCALLIPITYSFSAVNAFGMMLGCYVGGISGGAISACLLNIPGTPSSLVTTFDGYPMTLKGKGSKALGWAATASALGTFFSWLILVLLAPPLALLCTRFSSAEYAAIAFFGLVIVSAMSKKEFIKGIVAGLIGIFLSCVGVDAIYGTYRYTFGNMNLLGGIYLVPVVIGIFSIPQIIELFVENRDTPQPSVKMKDFLPSLKEIWDHKVNILRSSIIGTIVGIIPAIGGNTAAFFAYDMAKRSGSKDPTPFGEGNPDGVIASETANNGVCGGAMIPMLTLGIPGDGVTAILLGGLTIHGLRAGPMLFLENYNIVVGIFTTMFLATIFMFIIQLGGIKAFCKILAVPVNYLAPILGVLSIIGSYAIRNNFFDVYVCLALGIFAYLVSKAGYNLACIVLGLVLGSMFETELRLTLKVTNNNFMVFFTRPISLVILVITGLMMILTIYKNTTGKRSKYDKCED